MSQVLANVTHMNETCQIQACSVSRVNESCPRLSTRLHYPRPRLHYNRTLLQYTLSRLPFCSALGLFYTPIGRCRVSHTQRSSVGRCCITLGLLYSLCNTPGRTTLGLFNTTNGCCCDTRNEISCRALLRNIASQFLRRASRIDKITGLFCKRAL